MWKSIYPQSYSTPEFQSSCKHYSISAQHSPDKASFTYRLSSRVHFFPPSREHIWTCIRGRLILHVHEQFSTHTHVPTAHFVVDDNSRPAAYFPLTSGKINGHILKNPIIHTYTCIRPTLCMYTCRGLSACRHAGGQNDVWSGGGMSPHGVLYRHIAHTTPESANEI